MNASEYLFVCTLLAIARNNALVILGFPPAAPFRRVGCLRQKPLEICKSWRVVQGPRRRFFEVPFLGNAEISHGSCQTLSVLNLEQDFPPSAFANKPWTKPWFKNGSRNPDLYLYTYIYIYMYMSYVYIYIYVYRFLKFSQIYIHFAGPISGVLIFGEEMGRGFLHFKGTRKGIGFLQTKHLRSGADTWWQANSYAELGMHFTTSEVGIFPAKKNWFHTDFTVDLSSKLGISPITQIGIWPEKPKKLP